MSAFPVVLSAPSGGGKTTIARRLLAVRRDVGYSVSVTTRAPREGEVNGRDYHFWNEAEFSVARDRGEFAESAVVHGRHYGTLKREVQGVLDSGKHVVLAIDIQGAAQLVVAFPDAIRIFVLPPTVEALFERLGGRGSEAADEVRTRLRNAIRELHEAIKYDYVVVNQDVDTAVSQVGSILDAEGLRGVRIRGLEARVGKLVSGLERELESGRIIQGK